MAQIQNTFAVSASNIATASLTGVAAGSALIVVISQSTSATRSYTVVDDVDGALTPVQLNNPNRASHIYVLWDATAGSHTITVTADASSGFRIGVLEWGGLDSAATPVTGTYDDGADASTHYADDTGITTTGAAAIVVVGTLNSATGVSGLEPGGAYTEVVLSSLGAGASLTAFAQYYDAGLAVTDERGTWTSTGTARRGVSTIAAFPYEAEGTPPSASGGAFIAWFGR